MTGSDYLLLTVLVIVSSLQLSDAFFRSRNKQTAVSSDDALLHYVAECPVNYVIELSPITTGRSHALVECERTLWKVVYEHCQGQQTCLVSLPWVDMLKNKVECLNEIENYRPFHYQCRSFSDGPQKDTKGRGLVTALYEMAKKVIGHSSEEKHERQGTEPHGPKTAKASSSRRVSMTSYHRSPSSHARSSVRMSSSRRVSTSWNSWNGPMENTWSAFSGGNAIHDNNVPSIMGSDHSWNGWSGQTFGGSGWSPFGPDQAMRSEKNWSPWNMWNHVTPAPIREITPPRGSHWAGWNNMRTNEVHHPINPGNQRLINDNDGGREWTSWNSLNDWSSWAAKLSSGIDIVGTTPVSLLDLLFGRRGSSRHHENNNRVYELSDARDYPKDNETILARGTNSNDLSGFSNLVESDSDKTGPGVQTKNFQYPISKPSYDESKQDVSIESNALSVPQEPKILFDTSVDLDSLESKDGPNSSTTTQVQATLTTTTIKPLVDHTLDLKENENFNSTRSDGVVSSVKSVEGPGVTSKATITAISSTTTVSSPVKLKTTGRQISITTPSATESSSAEAKTSAIDARTESVTMKPVATKSKPFSKTENSKTRNE